jgi:hypothetical protein
LGLFLIIAAILFFLRRRRRSPRNYVLGGPVVPRGSLPGEILTRELPPIRAVTPMLWPQSLPFASNRSLAPVSDAGRGIVGSSNGEVATNPFTPTPPTHKLVDVESVRSSRNSRVSNPFEDNANSYLAEYPSHSSFGAVFSLAVANMVAPAQANHGRNLSNASTDCPYPVLEPNSPRRRISVRSELSYATLNPERVVNPQVQQPLTRYPSISSISSGSVNVSLLNPVSGLNLY